ALSASEKAGCWTWALQLLHDLADDGLQPDLISFRCALAGCARELRWEASLELLGDAQSTAGARSPAAAAKLTECFNLALSACKDALQWEQAVALLESMLSEGPAPDGVSLNTAASSCAQ
ncbi:unnamed protein product, partial [Polarella glacialis]